MTQPLREKYEGVIGLEVHAQLMTRSKMFSTASVAFGGEANTNVNEICAGLPGVLPVVNAQAVDFAIRAGAALGCTIHRWSQFARKNYFYADLPKGYQISQFDYPLCEGGTLRFDVDGEPGECTITRIHLEEDSGKSFHDTDGTHSLIDLNRAGTGLIEIVFEPELRSAEAAAACFKELRAILVAIGINDGNLAEASMRCDANISVRLRGDEQLGTKVEVKNLNSFKFLREAIEFEIDRQIDAIEKGERIYQETRLWSEERRETALLRRKEGSADYRYFPEPDLPPLIVEPERVERIRSELPELPAATRSRLIETHGLSSYDASVLVGGDGLIAFFDAAVAKNSNAKGITNWLTGSLAAGINAGEISLNDGTFVSGAGHTIQPDHVAELQGLIDDNTISTTIARDVWTRMLDSGRSPAAIVEEDGLRQVSDTSVLVALIDGILEKNPDKVAAFRGGKKGLMGFFVGQAMAATKGKADPKSVNALLNERLNAEGPDE